MTLQIGRRPGVVDITGPGYELEVRTDRPRARFSAGGVTWSELSLLASVDSDRGRDESYGAPDVEILDQGDVVEVRVTPTSSVWQRRTTVLRATADGVDLRVDVEGEGRLRDVILCGGAAVGTTGACGSFRSSIGFRSVLVPGPTEPVAALRSASTGAQLGVVGDAEPGRLHGIFSPPPLALALGTRAPVLGAQVPEDGEWCALVLLGEVATLGFTSMRYEPLDGGWSLRLAYEGKTSVDGAWSSPTVRLAPVGSPWDAMALLARATGAQAPAPGPSWWDEPIFCGWGAQCAAVAAYGRGGGDAAVAGLVGAGVAASAPALARQELYDGWLATLEAADLSPGTVVIDDRWQATYGTCEVDTEKWPDLRGWIAGQHAAGRKVLLWFKAWDPEGLPADECVTGPDGSPVAADPGSDAYLARLTRIVEHLLGPEGLDADGFKVDFTQRAPSGESLRHATDGVWGVAALHRLVTTVTEAARRVKPGALVINHTVDPRFADVTDMVRLNDVLERDVTGGAVPVVDQLRFRAAIVRAAGLGQPVDTDQWPMPNRAEWLAYVREQVEHGVPALYYLESIDGSGEELLPADLAVVAETWRRHRASL